MRFLMPVGDIIDIDDLLAMADENGIDWGTLMHLKEESVFSEVIGPERVGGMADPIEAAMALFDDRQELLKEIEELRSLLTEKQSKIEQYQAATEAALAALKQINSAASGLARVQAAIISRPKKGEL